MNSANGNSLDSIGMTTCTLEFPKKFQQQFIICKTFTFTYYFRINYLIGIAGFSSNQLHLHQAPRSIVISASFPLHVNQISTLPPSYILVKTVSQVTIPPRTSGIAPTTFNGMPKSDSCYSFIKPPVSYESQRNLFVLPGLKIFSKKLPVCLLCTIINTSSGDIVLPRNQHLGEMKLFSSIDDHLKPSAVNEVTHDFNHGDAQWMQPDSSLYNECKNCSNLQPVQKLQS